ncbi:Short-chain dehydrogenase [Pseudomonas flavescens]|uniref:Short-chain dehydrogenase n=1 Tax=Phytopseudomonas flavescens TaxID=29435 RepID=A0A1G8IDD0_9GAMM|nr:SDR family oxidoreductase [Pseudomonas flavescens]SDI16807.1 Short-chain dehydrogenase [Pseudomonas flavescens]
MSTILIIGGTSAIATACARLWAEQHGRFMLVGRNDEKLQQTAADLRARGADEVHTQVLDLDDLAGHAPMLERTRQLLPRIDIALVAHGSLPDQDACERDPEQAVRAFASNGLNVIALLTRLGNLMEAQGSGSLAVIASVAAERGRPSNYLYGSAKAAVSVFCSGLRARLYKSGVHLLTVKPGFVDTPMTQGLALPGPLLAQPERVARDILAALRKRRSTLYTPWFWAPIMLVIRLIPEFIFKRLSL